MTKEQKILYELEYNKALENLNKRIARATKKGYTFADNVIPKKPKTVSPKTIEKLNAIRGDVLYKKATNNKTVVKHPRKRNIDKARKQSRKYTYTDEEIKEKTRKKDKEDRYNTENTSEFSDAILTIQRVRDMIANSHNTKAVNELTALLDNALANDEENTLRRISNATEDVIINADLVLRYLGINATGTEAYNYLYFLITGKPLTAQQSADINDMYGMDIEEPNINIDDEGYIVVDKSDDNPWD